MARKGIAPWENGAGQIGTPELKWKQVCTNEIYADTLGGEIAKNTVAHITKNDDAISILYADGTKEDIVVEAGETTMGWCRKRRIEKSGNTVKLWWEDPLDGYAQWAKTAIVKKQGAYPESPSDGITVVTTTERDKYKTNPYTDTQADADKWYYRAFPVSAGGNTSYHRLNKFGFWHYAIWIDREDGVESTCVHNVDGYDNQGYRPIKMIFDTDVEKNALDWGDWENAQFMPKPCMLRNNGTVDYYLNPNNYNQKADGSPTTDISDVNYDGNAMMEWSPVFTKNETIGTKHYIYYCSEKLDDSYECYSAKKEDGNYGDHWYMPIYEGRVVNNVMRSLSTGTDGTSGAKPTASTTMDQEMTYAKANGTGWNITCWADENLVAMLGIMVMGRLNCAMAIGYNCGSSTSALTHNIGTANKKGMFFGHYTTSAYATKFFGMENWWGHRWRRCVGLITKDYKVFVKMTKSIIDGSTVQNYNSTADGYINTGITVPAMSGSYFVDVANSKYGYAIPTALTKYKGDTGTAGGSASTYYCDGGWSAGSVCALFSGGGVSGGAASGLFCFHVDHAPSYANWNLGASLSFKSF
nr:MAG TPA: PvdO maturation, periplasm, HYDROLASE.24A [Caudoviricetes sp.]